MPTHNAHGARPMFRGALGDQPLEPTTEEARIVIEFYSYTVLLIDGSGERRLEPRHGRVPRGVTPDDFGTLETSEVS